MRGKLDAVGIADHVVVKGHAAHPGEAHAPRLQHATAAARPARRERGAGGAVEVAGDEVAGEGLEKNLLDRVVALVDPAVDHRRERRPRSLGRLLEPSIPAPGLPPPRRSCGERFRGVSQ